MKFDSIVNEGIKNIIPYQAGKPIHELLTIHPSIKRSIKLASNENPLGPSPIVLASLSKALNQSHYYPDSQGTHLKLALSRFYQMDKDFFILGNGSDDIMSMLLKAYVSSQDEVIVSEYCFTTFLSLIHAANAKLVTVPANQWAHDLEKMLLFINAKTKLIMLANPNNPTGTCFTHKEFQRFLSRIPKHVLVLMDEAYYEFALNSAYPQSLSLLEKFPNLLITRTFSKAYGLAGLRIGYGIAHPDLLKWLNRIRLPFNVNSFALHAAELALHDQEHIKKTLSNNDIVKKELCFFCDENKLSYLPTHANFLTIHIGKRAESIFHQLLKLGIIVRPLGSYQMPEYLRISIGLQYENQAFMQALSTII